MRQPVSGPGRGGIGAIVLFEVEGDSFGIPLFHKIPEPFEPAVIFRLCPSRGLQDKHRILDDVVGTAFFDSPGIPMHSPCLAGMGISPAPAEDRPLDALFPSVGENEHPGRAPQFLRSEGIGDRLPHHMDPHIDIVFPHDFGQDKIELFPADPVVPFLEIGRFLGLLCGPGQRR